MPSIEPSLREVGPAVRSHVRIVRQRHDGFVEFAFYLDDPDLSVDLILPAAAFGQFCAEHRVHVIGAGGFTAAPASIPVGSGAQGLPE